MADTDAQPDGTPDKAAMLAEAYKRGLLTGDMKAHYEEAIKRGLVAAPEGKKTPTVEDRAAPLPRWDFLGDTGRAASGAASAVAQEAAQAFPSNDELRAQEQANRDKYGPIAGELKSGFIDQFPRFAAAAKIPLSALGVLASPVTGAVHSTLGSALSYVTPTRPGEDPKAVADQGIDLAMMGMGPKGSAGGVAGIEGVTAVAKAVNRAKKTAGLTNKAIDKINSRFAEDVQSGGATAQDVVDRLNESKAAGKPLAVVDVAGENVKGLAGNIARQPGPAKNAIKTMMEDRDKGAGDRVREDINQGLARGSTFEAEDELNKARARVSAPLYDAYRDALPMNPEEMAPDGKIGKLLNRPSVRVGVANAMKIAKEKGVDPTTWGVTFNDAGDPVFAKTPTWETLDFIKAGIDDVVEKYRDPTSGKLVLDRYGRAANDTRSEFLGAVDKLNPNYKPARDAWAGPSQSKDAIEWGKDFMGLEPEEIADRFKRFSPNEKEFARLGAAQTLRKMVSKTGKAGDETRRLIGNDYIKSQIKPMFDTQEGYDRFVKSLQMESDMFDTKYNVLGNSKTAERVAEDGADLGPMIHGAHAIGHAAKGNMLASLASGGRAMKDFLIRPNPALNSEIARLLMSNSPRIGQASGELLSRVPLPATQNLLVKGAVKAAQLNSLAAMFAQRPQPPQGPTQ